MLVMVFYFLFIYSSGFETFIYVTREPNTTAHTVTLRILLSFQYNQIDIPLRYTATWNECCKYYVFK